MLRTLVAALVGLNVAAQTQIDLSTQAKRIDFTAASSTRPMKTGTELPPACTVGDMFFNTAAPAGSNLYACTAANTWSLEGFSSQNCAYNPTSQTLQCQALNGDVFSAVLTSSSGTPNQWIDYISPTGVPHTSQPTAAAVGAVGDPGANGVPYRSGPGAATAATADNLSGPFFCQDSGTSGAYACNLSPAITAYKTGTTYWFKANTANSGAATINLNGIGPKQIVKAGGQALASSDIRAGQWVLVTYDGANMQMQSQTAQSPLSSVFGRTGAVAAQAGDYTTAQVTESGNLYFTNARAQAAFSFPGAVTLNSGAVNCPTCITTTTAADTDLSGTFPHLSVNKIQGRAVAATPPADLQYLGWNNTAGWWEPKTLSGSGPGPEIPSVFGRTGEILAQTGDYTTGQVTESGNLYFTNARAQAAFTFPGVVTLNSGAVNCPGCITSTTAADTDLSGNFPHLSVTKIQGRTISSATPSDLQYLGWNNAGSRWEPKSFAAPVATVFGRSGAVSAQAGDYTTAQVAESGNLYFTNARAQTAFTFPGVVTLNSGAVNCPTCITSSTAADTDLSGSFPHLTVNKIQGRTIAGATPTDLQYLGWNNAAGWWEPKTLPTPVPSVFGRTGAVAAQTGDYTTAQVTESGNLYFTNTRAQGAFTFPGVVTLNSGAVNCPTCITSSTAADTDLSGSFPHLTVNKIQGRTIAGATPTDLQYLGWNNASGQWEPKTLPGPAVAGVFGRTGTVAAQTGDYSFAQISGMAAASQLPATAMLTNQGNTITAGTQDFSGAAHTLPMKSGPMANLPGTCSVGETYFATDASAGNNVYGCTAPNTWAVEGAPAGSNLTVASNGVTVGSRPTANFVTGTGLMNAITDTGAQINVQIGLDSAVIQTLAGEQSGAALWCASGGGSGVNYQCSLTPTAAAYAAGMVLHWKPDVNGIGGATTLNVDTLGAIPVKLSDGTTNPTAADILAGRLYNVWYDGSVFRLMATSAGSAGGIADPGANGVLYRSGPGIAAAATAANLSAPFACQDAGSSYAYACDLNPAISAYTAGTTYWFKANTANSGAATINFNSLGAKPIKKLYNQALAANDILAGQWVMVTYDGVNMQMQSQTANAPAGGGNVASVFGRTGTVSPQSGDYTAGQITGLASSATIDTTNAANIASGTLPDLRLSGNVPLKNVANSFSQAQSFTAGESIAGAPITVTRTAGTGGVSANTLVGVNASGQIVTASSGTCGMGVAMSDAGAGTPVEVAISGTANLIADNTITAGDLLTGGTATPATGRDSGQTTANAIPLGTCIAGRAMGNAATGTLASVQLWGPGAFGSQMPATIGSNTTGNAATATALAAAPSKCAAGTYPLGVDAQGNALSCAAPPTATMGSSYSAKATFAQNATSATISYGVTLSDAQLVTGNCYLGTAGSNTPMATTGQAFTTTSATFNFSPATGPGWCVVEWAGAVRTWFYPFKAGCQGAISGGNIETPNGYAVSLNPCGAITSEPEWSIAAGGTCPTLTTSGCQWWWETLPQIPAVNPSLTVHLQFRSADSAHAATMQVGYYCVSPGSNPDSPVWVTAGMPTVTLTPGGVSTITQTSVSFTTTCAAGNDLRIQLFPTANTLTSALNLSRGNVVLLGGTY